MQIAKPCVITQKSCALSDNLQSTPMVLNGKQSRLGLDFFSPINPISEHAELEMENGKEEAGSSSTDGTMSVYSLKDVSSWIGGRKIIIFYIKNYLCLAISSSFSSSVTSKSTSVQLI